MHTDARFVHLMDIVPVLIWCADTEGRWTYVNKVWRDFTGTSVEQACGEGWTGDVHPDDVDAAVARIAEPVRQRAPFQFELRLRRYDGAWRNMLCSGAPRHDSSGEFAGFIGSFTDLTDMRAAEAQRQRDLDEKAAVMQELHHRVKNNAQIFASLLSVQASRAADPAVKAALRVAASRASTMAFAQQQIWDAGSSARFDLGALVRRLVRAQYTQDVEVEIEAPATLDVPLATAVPLGLIVHELLTNALHHGYPQGGVGRVCIALQRSCAETLVVSVSDDGVGLALDTDLETSRSAGLTIVRSLSRQLGACLEIETGAAKMGAGTTVTLSVPCPEPG